jgi:hypothetical protein
MNYKPLILTALALFVVLAASSCNKRKVTDEMREQALQARGQYEVVGQLDLYPFEQGDTVHNYIDFQGHATADTTGDANLRLTYVSDLVGDTTSVVVSIDEAGVLLFKRFKITRDGMDASATSISSTIQRHGNDTVSGVAHLRLSLLNGLYTRLCDMTVEAVRSPL